MIDVYIILPFPLQLIVTIWSLLFNFSSHVIQVGKKSPKFRKIELYWTFNK